jgi:hypothetical protein
VINCLDSNKHLLTKGNIAKKIKDILQLDRWDVYLVTYTPRAMKLNFGKINYKKGK